MKCVTVATLRPRQLLTNGLVRAASLNLHGGEYRAAARDGHITSLWSPHSYPAASVIPNMAEERSTVQKGDEEEQPESAFFVLLGIFSVPRVSAESSWCH